MTRAATPGMLPSTQEMRTICQKGVGEIFLVSQFVYRPFTIYVTKAYAYLGWGPTACTLHSLLAALVAAAVLLWPRPSTFIVASLGLQTYFVLDHVDGELARLFEYLKIRRMSIVGEYLDFWVHFHSANLAFATLGVGLFAATGNVLWAALGILAANGLGNFPRLTLSRTLLRRWASKPITNPDRFQAISEMATDLQRIPSAPPTMREGAFRLLRETLVFPGCLVLLSLILAADAIAAVVLGTPLGVPTSIYLALFAAVVTLSSVHRTRSIVRELRLLDE